jgi:hypothetical protein
MTLIRLPDTWKHDIKNQLGIVIGFSDLLLQEMDPADTRRADVEEIYAAARRSMALVEQLEPEENAGA